VVVDVVDAPPVDRHDGRGGPLPQRHVFPRLAIAIANFLVPVNGAAFADRDHNLLGRAMSPLPPHERAAFQTCSWSRLLRCCWLSRNSRMPGRPSRSYDSRRSSQNLHSVRRCRSAADSDTKPPPLIAVDRDFGRGICAQRARRSDRSISRKNVFFSAGKKGVASLIVTLHHFSVASPLAPR